MPRKPAQKPWLAEGVSRSTWYRRKKIVQNLNGLAAAQTLKVSGSVARASAFVAQLQAELAEAARRNQVAADIIVELAAISCARSPASIGRSL
jgi:ACT domain-containing protein